MGQAGKTRPERIRIIMNINAASLADILKLNGVFSDEGRNGKKESGIRGAGGTETAGAG